MRSARVLVVEDNPTNLALMSYLLNAFGHQVLVATDGVDAIERARAEKPDLILMDLHMPRMDGYQAAAILKADPMMSSIPIVAVTAFAMVGDRDRILKGGFDGYLPKPISPTTFVSEIEAFITPKGAQ